MISLFELQTASGQLWLDITERLAAKDATITALTAERDKLAITLAAFIAADDAGVTTLREEAAKSEAEKELDAAQAKLDAAQAELTAATEKVEALK